MLICMINLFTSSLYTYLQWIGATEATVIAAEFMWQFSHGKSSIPQEEDTLQAFLQSSISLSTEQSAAVL